MTYRKVDRKDFIREGRKRYRKFYRMVALATAISVAVISGSLIIGDSVRKSLQKRVEDRLFGMKSVVVSADGFLGSEALAELSLGEESRGILLSDGFVSRGGRLYPVMVWGMDALPDGSPIGYGEAVLNAELQEDLGDMTDPTVVLRLPSDGLVPSSSLFVTSRYSTSLRLEYKGSLDASHGGNLSLRNGQVIPYNVFVSREELCESLGVGDKVNVILSPGDIRKENLSSLTPSALGIRMEDGRITRRQTLFPIGRSRQVVLVPGEFHRRGRKIHPLFLRDRSRQVRRKAHPRERSHPFGLCREKARSGEGRQGGSDVLRFG